jgi:hypothetical protein
VTYRLSRGSLMINFLPHHSYVCNRAAVTPYF